MKASDFTEKRLKKMAKNAQEDEGSGQWMDNALKVIQENPEIITTLIGALGGGAAGGAFGDSDSLINKWTGALAGGGAGYAAPGMWDRLQNKEDNVPLYDEMNGITDTGESGTSDVEGSSEEDSGFPLKETAAGAGAGAAGGVGLDYLRNLRNAYKETGNLTGRWNPEKQRFQTFHPNIRAAGDTARDIKRLLTLSS